ncbi:MAG TPA: hypothetical protein VFQ80_04150 [Thermomicrobiales bacterium]|jgi:hypothetical protein|nr:hypothetical protein [Thermomicrobiales bacterium]
MSDAYTLHPFDEALVARFVQAVLGEAPPESAAPAAPDWSRQTIAAAQRGYAAALTGNEAGANAVTAAFARVAATEQPTFYLPDAGLTVWEARIDRGIGMLLRPPSRLFGDAGLATPAARAMPIRLDPAGGVMGGAFIPARLVPDLQRLLDAKAERLVRRLLEAELDGVALLGQMMTAADYAAARGFGLFEAADAIVPEAPAASAPGVRLVEPGRKRLAPELRKRLEAAAKPPKRPGVIGRLFGRGKPAPTAPPPVPDE